MKVKRVMILALVVGLAAELGDRLRRQQVEQVQQRREHCRHDLERAGQHVVVRVQPVQLGRQLVLGRAYLRRAHVREQPPERGNHQLARLELRVEQRQQDAHVHDPTRRQVERRQAADRGRRPLHLQPDQEVPRPQPEHVLWLTHL